MLRYSALLAVLGLCSAKHLLAKRQTGLPMIAGQLNATEPSPCPPAEACFLRFDSACDAQRTALQNFDDTEWTQWQNIEQSWCACMGLSRLACDAMIYGDGEAGVESFPMMPPSPHFAHVVRRHPARRHKRQSSPSELQMRQLESQLDSALAAQYERCETIARTDPSCSRTLSAEDLKLQACEAASDADMKQTEAQNFPERFRLLQALAECAQQLPRN